MLPNVPLIMSTTENPETTETTGTEEPVLVPPTEEAPTPESTPEPEAKPEPKPATPEPDVKRCKFSAEGTFDKGIVDCKLSKSSKIDLERAQIIILVQNGRRHTYSRTNIE